ncbi:hypothetical protein [Bacillus tequilensis]|uniref:hypothetical protein n=1 Tax=Bacillus tequilensis TaxID=227866 RepID=UPI0004650ACE|nr:hypothetical protein [Bacillus tequilensis]MDR4435136.1 hypothetical protein [Bacillus tequilensis]SPU04857.1 manganese ABC transporter permease [Bacillus tequilensis]
MKVMLILSALLGVMGYFFANVVYCFKFSAGTGECYTGTFLFLRANGGMTEKLRALHMQKERAG